MPSALKAYWLPLLLLSASIVFQLFVIPLSFPHSHYDVLGVKRYCSIEEVEEAYMKLMSKWNSGAEVRATTDFIKMQYAYELLRNPLWKRDYDNFGIDEQHDLVEAVKGQYAGKSFSEIDLPLLVAPSFDHGGSAFNAISSEEFLSIFDNERAWLIKIYSSGSSACAKFLNNWKKIDSLLDDVANTGMVELGEAQLATYLAEKRPTGQPFFRNGLPSLVAFPSGCRNADCMLRYEGGLSVDAVTDWFATTILSLPRILFYSKESLGQGLHGSPHKVKAIFFSKTGERATPFVRQAAKNYWAYAQFAYVLWRLEESSFWWNMFEVDSAPAIVILKDPGVKPLVHHGPVNSSWLLDILERNKMQVLPQLRSVTSMELGCDAKGYSRAGNDTTTWYCVILAGRQSLELNKMRETIRKVQETLSRDDKLNAADKDPSAIALKNKRLTFAWLDGEAQKKYCFFYLNSENSYETCGPRRAPIDVPQLFIVRYKRNATEDSLKVEKKRKTVFDAFLDDDVDPASQLVARYNGSDDISLIIQWVSNIIEDGDSKDLPYFRTKTPELIPEDADPIWSRGARSIASKSMGVKEGIFKIRNMINDHLGDPRIGPLLLLGALIFFGKIWLQRSQSSHPNSSQPSRKDEVAGKRRKRAENISHQDRPSSITDVDPKDAYQFEISDSDSD